MSVPAKINLSLRVGARRPDGYHDLSTIFHAISLRDEVTVESAPAGSGRTLEVTGGQVDDVPLDDSNLAARASIELARVLGLPEPDLRIHIAKSIPVAGGMAGGSADAAAVLVACRRLWSADIDDAALLQVAAKLGSDVPFSLHGGTARGTGRGEMLTSVLARGELHWVVALNEGTLQTPAVYAEWDRLVESGVAAPGGSDDDLLVALRHGDPADIGPLLANDLQVAALSLKPALQTVLETGLELGAHGGIVSGSGPTVVFLADGRDAALDLAVALSGSGLVRGVRHAVGPVAGAQVIR